MSRLGYVDKIQDPSSNGDWYEIVDSNARELVHKIEKTIVDSLPAKPNTRDKWLEMEPYLYYVPITGKENEFDVWTLFFIGDPSVASDYTDLDNYQWTKVVSTDVDMSNVSMVGHTHEVIPEISVDDHNYTPQGTVNSSFEGYNGNTDSKTHWHTVTPSGSVSSSFSGTPGNTNTGYADISFSKDGKKLSKLAVSLRPVTSVDLTSSTTTSVAKPTFASNSGSYDSTKSIFNGILVSGGVLSFVTKKLDTADAYTGLQGSIAASNITIGGSGNTDCYMANGDVESGTDLLGYDSSVSDKGHIHSYTPSGSVSSLFSGSQVTTSQDTHSHQFTPNGDITSSFRGLRANLKHKVDSKKVRTSPDQEDPSGYVFDWYGIRYPENASSRFKERIGNMDMHRMLPIQTKMRRCILGDDGEVKYYLDDRDSTKRAGSQEGYVTSEETFMSKVETDEIRDETETIEKIEGKSVAWNQGVNNVITFGSNVGQWQTFDNETSLSIENNSLKILKSSGYGIAQQQMYGDPIIYGHRYYIAANIKTTAINEVLINAYGVDVDIAASSVTTSTDWQRVRYIRDCNVTVPSSSQYFRITDGRTSDFDAVYAKDFVFIDLTLLGLGSFTTVAQVEEWLEKNVGKSSYYPYCSGELLSYGGKIVKWNQQAPALESANWENLASTESSFSNGVCTFTTNDSYGGIATAVGVMSIIAGHKYYQSAEAKSTANIKISDGENDAIRIDIPASTSFVRESLIRTCISNHAGNILVWSLGTSGVSQEVQLKNIKIIDLTLMFGAGSEPTLEECEKLFTEDYYPHNAGENKNLYSIEGVDMGYKTVGFNQWDEEWENGTIDADGQKTPNPSAIRSKNYIPVLPSTAYYFRVPENYTSWLGASFYDKNLNFISGGGVSANFTSPANASYLIINVSDAYGNTYNHDICINISDPKRNGEYEPYNAHYYPTNVAKYTGINSITGERELIAPNGFKGVNNVLDLLYRENGVTKFKKTMKRLNFVDLDWVYVSSETLFSVLITDGAFTNNCVCGSYATTQNNYASMPDKSIRMGDRSLSGSNYLIVHDSSYTNADDLKAANADTYIDYELATPILYTDIQDENGNPVILPIEMEVEHNGTISIEPNAIGGAPSMVSPTIEMKKYVLTQGANLDGSDGQVMVEIPEHWRKVYKVNESGTDYVYAKISPYPQEGWHHVEKNYVGAFEASIVDGKLSSSSDIKDLVYSHDANGKIVVSCNLSTSRMPKTYQYDDNGTTIDLNVDNYRMLARRRNDNASAEWNGFVVSSTIDLAWLFFIEYACTNSQEPVKNGRDANGFMQGGLGMGFSEFFNWESYNNYYPVVPCGVTACMGNHSGEILITVDGTNYTVNTYRGVEIPFGHLWKLVDGVKYHDNTIYRAVNPADFSNDDDQGNYVEVGTKGTSNGYVTTVKIQKDSGYDERFDGDLTPTGVGGDTASYYCDYYWKSSGWMCCSLGGSANRGEDDGFVYADSANGLAFSNQNFGSRLCFLPSHE